MSDLILVEGESDALTLWWHRYSALGIPGASNISCLKLEHLAKYSRIFIVAEPDAAGQKVPANWGAHLRDIGFQGDVRIVFMREHKDPSALHIADPDGFKAAFDALLARAERFDEPAPTAANGYEINQKTGATAWIHMVREQPVAQELANFNARIIGEVTKDDGASAERILTVRAQVGKTSTIDFEVGANEFDSLKWVKNRLWGAYIRAGNGVRDRVRDAIESLSPSRARRTVFTHTGWREISGDWVYLHADGGIGPEGARADISAELPPTLAEFKLPAPPEGAELREALKITASLVDVGDPHVTLPIFASIWRAAISTCDFSFFLVGKTGAYKSSLAAIAMEHFGAGWSRRHLPANWHWTANALEDLTFRAKDALLVIDDFRPAAHAADRELQQKAERILRAQGNRAGRGRLWADGSERPVREPRGMIFATAEDYVWLASLESRTLVIEIAQGQISQERLATLHQAGATGLLASAMAGWVKWLAPRLSEVRKRLEYRAEELQVEHQRTYTGIHGRSAEILGELQATLEVWQEFSGIKLPAIREVFSHQAETDQIAQAEVHDQASQFAALYMQALGEGRTHARTMTGMKPSGLEADLGWSLDAQGRYIPQGRETSLWVDEQERQYYLAMDTAHTIVMSMCRDGNGPSGSVRRLMRTLAEGGWLSVLGEKTRQTLKVRRTIRGMQISVLAIEGEKWGLPKLP